MFTRWLEFSTKRSCLLIGPRRSGKTTLLRKRYPELRYATLDDLDYLDWAERDPKGFVQDLGTSAIIDEIQRCPRLTIAVKHAIDQAGGLFLMTGSSTLGLVDAAADTLAGRIDILSLPTACWGEELGEPTHAIFTEQAHPLQLKEGNRLLQRAMTFGQFPEALTCETDEQKEEALTRYKNTYFTRDLMQISNIENLAGLLGILHNLAHSLGSHLEVSNFAREAGVSHPTAKKYLNALDQAQLTFQLQGYHLGPAKRFLKATKTYFADNGIIRSLNVPLAQGQLLESFVIAELEKRRKLGYIPADRFYYYKSAAGHEVDLVFELKDKICAIEIKSTRKPGNKDISILKNFEPKKKIPTHRFLFYTGEEYATVDNVRLIPVAALFRGK
ncbi:MAG: ATP-binding protein [Syntrophales bacterium]|jgi:predicted AAA+ superfamily ATPase|nr:ATP-binding protein [Syntrophales bacterium]MDY0045043.1 ATP-binding protein [Syntrophales bacterium]